MAASYDLTEVFAAADLVTLPTYDFASSLQTPNEANHPAALINGKFDVINEAVGTSMERAAKAILAIPTFGRTWKLDDDSSVSGVPPVRGVGNPGDAGPLTKTAGLLSYPEICSALSDPNYLGGDTPLLSVTDAGGVYAFRLADGHNDHGIWVGYEDVVSVRRKVDFMKAAGLGGVAIVSIDLDDFRGTCGGEKYPILRAAKNQL